MEEKIPYVVYEAMQAKNERTTKRLIMALMISIILLFACNAVWLYAWMQFEYVNEEVTVDGEGIANYIGANGVINNGSNSRP